MGPYLYHWRCPRLVRLDFSIWHFVQSILITIVSDSWRKHFFISKRIQNIQCTVWEKRISKSIVGKIKSNVDLSTRLGGARQYDIRCNNSNGAPKQMIEFALELLCCGNVESCANALLASMLFLNHNIFLKWQMAIKQVHRRKNPIYFQMKTFDGCSTIILSCGFIFARFTFNFIGCKFESSIPLVASMNFLRVQFISTLYVFFHLVLVKWERNMEIILDFCVYFHCSCYTAQCTMHIV